MSDLEDGLVEDQLSDTSDDGPLLNDEEVDSDGEAESDESHSANSADSQENDEASASDTEAASNADAADESEDEPEDEPEAPEYGLLKESPPSLWQEYDVVVVHGIRQTQWTTEEWRQGSGKKESTNWIFESLGFKDGRMLHFQYPIDELPDVVGQAGIEQEAQRLLNGLVEMRREFDEYSTERGFPSRTVLRPIIFVTHDIGGIIVKKALVLASRDPARYGDIPYNTTTLFFLGCPHRGNRVSIENSVTRLLLLDDSSETWLLNYVTTLTNAIQQVNEEFLDTKMLIRASVYNVYNTAEDPDSYTPFDIHRCSLDVPFEFLKAVSVEHLDLVNGDESVEDTDDHYVESVREKLNEFPYYVNCKEDIVRYHKVFLSLAPPLIPVNTDEFAWVDVYGNMATLVTDSNQFKEWKSRRGMNALHIRGSSNMKLRSEKLYNDILGEFTARDVLFFAFKRHDARFNNLSAMLTSFLSQLISRHQRFGGMQEDLEMVFAQRAWTERDLLQLFELFHDFYDVYERSTAVFMIAGLDECDESRQRFLDLLAEFKRSSELTFKFIFTTTCGADEHLDDTLAGWPLVDLDNLLQPDEDEEPFDKYEWVYKYQMQRLFAKKPIYLNFEQELRDLVEKCGDDHRLGYLIMRWLMDNGQTNTKAKVRKTLRCLESATPTAVIETIFASFESRESQARNLFSWVTWAFEPPTIMELAVAMKLVDGADEDDVQDTLYDETRDDVLQFGRVFRYSEYEVDFWHPAYSNRSSDPNEAMLAHAKMALLCIRYLSYPSVRDKMKRICDCCVSLDQAPASRPREDLISYAVTYWHEHYKLAGDRRPVAEAIAFLEDRESRNAWARVRYVLSNPVTRIQKSYFSALPLVAAVGLEDILTTQLGLLKTTDTFSVDVDLALIEAIHSGHSKIARLLVETSGPSSETLKDALVTAAAVGEENTLNYLVSLAAEIKEFEWPNIFPRVAWLGLASTVSLLIDSGAKIPNAEGEFRNSPLHLASEMRHSKTVQALLRETKDVNLEVEGQGQSGGTPLHVASFRGDVDTIRVLLDAGADVKINVAEHSSSVNQAAGAGRPLALKMLIEAGTDISCGTDSTDHAFRIKPMLITAIGGYIECTRLLINAEADLTPFLEDNSVAWHAANYGHFDICRLLLENGADPRDQDEGDDGLLAKIVDSGLESTELIGLVGVALDKRVGEYKSNNEDDALYRAAKNGNKELVEYLLDRGLPPDPVNESTEAALYTASFNIHEEIVNLLIDRGADINRHSEQSGGTPLHAAYDNPAIAKIMLDHGADINTTSISGTIVHLTAKHNQPEVLDMLLNYSPKPNLDGTAPYREYEDDTPMEGMTPLCIACKSGHVEIMTKLLQNGVNINHRTSDGSFPLDLCLRTDSVEVVQTLLEFRPDLSQVDDAGNTILHKIQSSTPLAAVKLLYLAGADIKAINKAGETVLSLAVENNKEVALFFISRGADVNSYMPDGGTVLNRLAAKGDWELFKAAIDAGSDVRLAQKTSVKHTLLHSAVYSNPWSDDKQKILEYLLKEYGLDPNERNRDGIYPYPIFWCARAGYSDAVKLLLEHGASVEAEDSMGRRLIHLAAVMSLDCVRALLGHDAEVLPKTKIGMTPLHFASANAPHVKEFLEILSEKLNDDPASQDVSGNKKETVVDSEDSREEDGNIGAGEGDDDASKSHVGKNISREIINAKDIDGWTPLMWASKGNHSNGTAIHTLVEHGADLWVTGKVLESQGHIVDWSPLKAARYFGSKEEVCDALVPSEKTRILRDGRIQEWDDEQPQSREAKYYDNGSTCDYCVMHIVGIVYKCRDCDFSLCYKCVRSKHILHPDHIFEAVGPEFADEKKAEEVSESGDKKDKSPSGTHNSDSDDDGDEEDEDEEEDEEDEYNESSG